MSTGLDRTAARRQARAGQAAAAAFLKRALAHPHPTRPRDPWSSPFAKFGRNQVSVRCVDGHRRRSPVDDTAGTRADFGPGSDEEQPYLRTVLAKLGIGLRRDIGDALNDSFVGIGHWLSVSTRKDSECADPVESA